jgi:hypothetical protein
MPPVYKKIRVTQRFDGDSDIDLRSFGINLVYFHNWINRDIADEMFKSFSREKSVLRQHSYIGNFNRKITPHRLTYAHVPDDRHYRFRGKELFRKESNAFVDVFNQLVSNLPDAITSKPDASITNGYRYNGDDYIAPHIDDEKFLVRDTCQYWSDPTVCTVTLLRDDSERMQYRVANPDSDEGVSITMRHGSLVIQGSVIHEILPYTGNYPDLIGRISITLRCLYSRCRHNGNCRKPNCLLMKKRFLITGIKNLIL